MEQKIAKIKQELISNYKFIKYNGLILDTFATTLLKLCNSDVSKTIEYLETLSKKDITDKFICIIKDFETSNEISEIIKSSIQIENEKVKVRQEKVNELDKETNDLLEYKEELEADLAKLKTEQEKITDDFKQKCQARETMFTDKIKQLEITKDTLQNTIDGVYRNELYEDEFNIPECKYILKEPTIHLNVDKIIEDLNENTCEISNINKNNFICELSIYSGSGGYPESAIWDHRKCNTCFGNPEILYKCVRSYSFHNRPECFVKYKNKENYEIQLNFPIDIILNGREFIIKIYLVNNNIIYITNFGRFITTIKTNIIYENFKTILKISQHPHFRGYITMIIGGESNKIILNELPTLTFRIPKIFLDVIDAFHQQNNDLMQECCKRYLDITRETDRKKEILTTLQFNKTIKEKDDIIARKEKIINEHSVIIDYQNEELEKLKNENAKLKKALQSFLNE